MLSGEETLGQPHLTCYSWAEGPVVRIKCIYTHPNLGIVWGSRHVISGITGLAVQSYPLKPQRLLFPVYWEFSVS